MGLGLLEDALISYFGLSLGIYISILHHIEKIHLFSRIFIINRQARACFVVLIVM